MFHFRLLKMASKDGSKSKSKFPRRILSSLRRNKKSNLSSLSYKNDFLNASTNDCLNSSAARLNYSVTNLDQTQNETALINLEATLPLDSPVKNDNRFEEAGDTNDETTNLQQPNVDSYRPINEDVSILENVSRNLLHANNLLSPNSRRVELGGPMSASTDSGIDCSVLMSEKSSPEQFVAFTRREAERLRQEQQIAGFNESILEPVTEVDSRSSSDVENENKNSASQNMSSYSHVENTEVLQTENAKIPENAVLFQCRSITDVSNSHAHSLCTSENGDYVTLSGQNELIVERTSDHNDYVTLTTSPNRSSLCISQQSLHTITYPSVTMATGLSLSIQSPQSTSSISSHDSDKFVDGDYVNYCANKTDDSKSAEAQFRLNDSLALLPQVSVSHDIVNPVPIISTSIAKQRSLPPTSVPATSATLFVNENSAFAKCKSIKRSVSDVGKGILGRFRHRSKDSMSSNESVLCDTSRVEKHDTSIMNSVKKFKKAGSKKWKEKVHGKGSQKSLEKKQSGNKDKVAPVLKEILPNFSQESLLTSNQRKSPVMKEVLCYADKQKISENISRQGSPINPISIQDLTNSICQMTSALHASSAESIACICDCKNRNVNPECCEKRKTPSPPSVSLVKPMSSCEQLRGNISIVKPAADFELFNNTEDLGDQECMTNGESECACHGTCSDLCDSDEDASCDDSDDQCEGDNLDCSIYSIASPETGKHLLLSDEYSSDSETCSLNSFGGSSDSSDMSEPQLDKSQSCQLDMSASAHSLNTMLASDENKCDNICDSVSPSNSSSSSERESPLVSDKYDNCESMGACGFSSNIVSPSGASFREVDFDNGEVMYVDNSLCEDFDDFMDSESPKERYFKPNSFRHPMPADPAPSPCVTKDRSNKDSPLRYPINKSWGVSNHGNQNVCESPQLGETNRVINSDDLEGDTSFTNISFEGSFAESSFSVRTHRKHQKHSRTELERLVDFEQTVDLNTSKSVFEVSKRAKKRPRKNEHNISAPAINFSSSFKKDRESHRSSSDLAHCNRSIDQRRNHDLNKSVDSFERNSLRRSYSAIDSPNRSFSRNSRMYSSFHDNSPCPSPLDLSMNKSNKEKPKDKNIERLRGKSSKWLQNHVGQVMSPARRVLHKNRGVSESDLCKEILNLYVSDVDESGLEALDNDESMNTSSTSLRNSSSIMDDDNDGSSSDGSLKFGTYVAPRHVLRETNVDDFSTTTVWTCYSGEARTRRLQGKTQHPLNCLQVFGQITCRSSSNYYYL